MKNSKPYREYDRWETKAKKSANREYRDKKSDQSLQLAVEPRERFDPILYDTFPEDIDGAWALDEAMARWRDHGEFYIGSTSYEPNSGWGK